LILQPLVKIKSQKDIQGVIASLTSRKYGNSWWYFSTRHQINLKFNDELHDTVNDHTRYKIAHYEYGRLLDACLIGRRPWPRQAETERFFAEYGLGPASEMTKDVTTNRGLLGGHSQLNQGPATKNRFAFHGNPDVRDPKIEGLNNSYVGTNTAIPLQAFDVHADIDNFRLKLNGSERHTNIADGMSREYLQDQIVARQRPHFGAQSKIGQIKHAALVAHHKQIPDSLVPFAAGTTNQLMDRMLAQIDHLLDSKAIFVYPLCIDGESDNPSGSVNFSKVSHANFSFDMTGYSGNTQSTDVEFYIDLFGVSYNWLQIRDGRALVSFA
jgi:hypothetical protein